MTKPQAPLRCVPSQWRANKRTQGGTAKRRITKCGGRDGKESECLVVPEKRGNPALETLWREGGTGRGNC
jgi:hypothetical protein